MATLYDWQKISSVISGKPFGDGKDGNATISSSPNAFTTASGTAGSTSLTIGSAILSNDDLIFIRQEQGSGAGQWEVNRVLSGGGTTNITLKKPLQYTYSSKAQVIKVPRYLSATVNAHSITAWNGTTGGVEIIVARNSITVNGAINGNGADGVSTGPGPRVYPVNGGGFRGGWSDDAMNSFGQQGESPTGVGSQSSVANGMGGGAGGGNAYYNAGGGGGHATSGTSATGSRSTNGQGGGIGGSADLTTMVMGAGGGGATGTANSNQGSGANGGGIIVLVSKKITLNAAVSCNGGGHNWTNVRVVGGGGAGGSILLVCQEATLGTGLITATGGITTDSESEKSGDGGNGRIALHYSKSYIGSTNPAPTIQQDTSLKEKPSSGFLMFM